MTNQALVTPKPVGERLKELLKADELDPILLAVANLYLQEKDIQEIALDLNIRADRVAQILDQDAVQLYIRETLVSQGYLNPFRRLKLITGVIESKIAKGIQDENMSDKDLLEWIKEARAMKDEIKPKKTGVTTAIQVNNNYESLVRDILK